MQASQKKIRAATNANAKKKKNQDAFTLEMVLTSSPPAFAVL